MDLGVAEKTAGNRRFSQETADFCRNRFLPICCLPFGALLTYSFNFEITKWRGCFGGQPSVRQEKRATKIKFLGPETARWGGGLPREGVVAENFVPALETLSSLGFEERNPGCPGNFAGMSRTPGGVQKVCAKKLRAHFSFRIQGRNRA